MGEAKWVSIPCWHDCGGACALKALVEDGKIVRVKTDDTHPDSWEHPQSRACAMGRAMRQKVYGPGRLKYPMKRKHYSPEEPNGHLRGVDDWERISWDEALDYIAAALKAAKEEYGNESILYQRSEGYLEPVLSAFGGYVDALGNTSYGTFAFGGPTVGFIPSAGNDRFDLKNSDYLVLYGYNLVWCGLAGAGLNLKKAVADGVKVVFVGPEYSATAGMANAEWIPVRPSTDTAFLLGVAYSMLEHDGENGCIDWDYLNRCTVGFDAEHMPEKIMEDENFVGYLRGEYDGVAKTQQWASEICGTPVELIDRFAEIMSCKNNVAVASSSAAARAAGAENFPQLLMTVAAMGGHFGKPGNSCSYQEWYSGLNKGDQAVVVPMFLPNIVSNIENKVDLAFPHDQLWAAVADGVLYHSGTTKVRPSGYGLRAPEKRPTNIHVIISDQNNVLNNQPGLNKGIEAHRKVDFVAALGYTMKADALYADVVLPITTRLERQQAMFYAFFREKESAVAFEKAIEPMYECRDDRDIAEALATRLGLDYSEINPKTDAQLWFDQMDGTMVLDGSGVPTPLCSVTQADLDRYGVEGAPHDGVISFEQFISDGIYRVKRTEDDGHVKVSNQAFRENPEANPLSTDTGKMEIYSLKKAGAHNFINGGFGGEGAPSYVKVPALPKYLRAPNDYQSSFEDWEAKKPGCHPVQMTSLHYPRRIHSEFDDLPWLREAFVNPVFINKQDAAERGIEQGDTVRVFNDYGQILRPAAVVRTVMPGVIVIPHGARPRIDAETGIDLGGNMNTLTGSGVATTPFVQPWNTGLCQYEKYEGPLELLPDCEVVLSDPLDN
ncbi:MAG: molybdopterin-dependent oxidoreductase [Eggerthellaceae bacterium]|nr:molybdopterin-dependent oxidoreductase [Eggerthellaceae bacterium]